MDMNPRVDVCQLCDELPTRRTLDIETVLVAVHRDILEGVWFQSWLRVDIGSG